MTRTLTPLPVVSDEIANSEGYKKLLESVERDHKTQAGFHDYNEKLIWALDRAKHYAEKTGLSQVDILNAWERLRDYWYMNYYQDANFPLIEGDKTRVFDAVEDLHKSVAGFGFRCPACDGVSRDPYTCDTGKKVMITKGKGKKAKLVESGKVCDWKVYGLFGHMGKGVYVFVKKEMRGQNVFKPVAWETEEERKGRPTLADSVPLKPKEEAVTKPPISETSAAGFVINDRVGYKSVKSDTEFQHEGVVLGVYPDGIPSCKEPMLKIEGKSGTVLASHCTLLESK